jgi:hypothetical protein
MLLSIVVIGGLEILGTRQFSYQLGRIVNENREMLRTDRDISVAKADREKWNLLAGSGAEHTYV